MYLTKRIERNKKKYGANKFIHHILKLKQRVFKTKNPLLLIYYPPIHSPHALAPAKYAS